MGKNLFNISLFLAASAALLGCKAHGDYQGLEYAPNMYHSVAYEPLKQITDKDAGKWVNSSGQDIGEYYSSNPNNPYSMNMRLPVPNTVPRGKFLPYRIPKDSLDLASRILKNPLDSTKAVLAKGKVLYGKFCSHCHGIDGHTPGIVGEKFAGVPAYNSAALRDVSGGHIFHVITWGKGRMGSHGSQLNIEERWEIVRYVQTLQKN